MNKKGITKFLNAVRRGVNKHSPELLTGIGIAGMVTTVVLAVKATPKALMLLEDAQYEKKDTLTAIEKCKTVWKCYAPATVTGALSIAAIIGAQSVSARRTAALATAYKLSETALAEFKDAAVEVVGEEKIREVKDKIAKDRIDKNSVNSSNVIITGNGNVLCLDGVYGQYFESDMDRINKAINNLNYRLLSEQYVSLNDFYDELGVDRIPVGDSVGWNISKHGQVDVEFSSQIAKDGRPCIVLEYTVAPQYDYYKCY